MMDRVSRWLRDPVNAFVAGMVLTWLLGTAFMIARAADMEEMRCEAVDRGFATRSPAGELRWKTPRQVHDEWEAALRSPEHEDDR